MSNMLFMELDSLQSEYRDLLASAIENWDEKSMAAVLEEINIFWKKNQHLVNCALSYMSAPYRTYLFTGATVLGVEDNEHYPFLCLGDFHIWDDPIGSYIKTVLSSPYEPFSEKLKAQVKETIADNIRIVDTLKGQIYILPVRMLSEFDTEIHEYAMTAFLSIFKEEMSFDDYKKRFKTIDDIIPAIKIDIDKLLVFDTESGASTDLKTRFENYRSDTSLPIPRDTPDAIVFWFGIYSYLAQTVDILMVCAQYKLVPYIRNGVTFQYLLILSESVHDSLEISQMLFCCIIAHVLHHSFNLEVYATIPIADMCRALCSGSFEQHLFESLNNSQISLDAPNLAKISEIIQHELSGCLT